MPYIITEKGSKINYTPNKIANIISTIYERVYGKSVINYRSTIINKTQDVLTELSNLYGNDKDSLWQLNDIHNVIKKILQKENNIQINLQTNDLLYSANKKSSPEKEDKFYINDKFAVNPTWNISVLRDFEIDKPDDDILINLGSNIKRNTVSRKIKTGIRKVQITKRRSDWIKWLKSLAYNSEQHFSIEALEKIFNASNTTYTFNSDGWYSFIENNVFEAIKEDPRLFAFLRIIQQRKARANIIGQDWLDGSDLNIKPEEKSRKLFLLEHPDSDDIYRALWIKNIQRLAKAKKIDPRFVSERIFDLNKIANMIDPSKDILIDWRGYQYLRNGGCLWEIPEGFQWELIAYPKMKAQVSAYEPPQWTWMRLAMSLALNEKDPQSHVFDFYSMVSKLAILPSETMLREAGKITPNFLEDKSIRIDDDFDSIYGAINQAAVNTKWTGTVALDWRNIRSTGSSIRDGIRVSKGITPFLDIINMSLLSQGRPLNDNPVTSLVPIWHLETIKLLKTKENKYSNIQTVFTVSDLFMKRLFKNEKWTLFDPAFFPELKIGDELSYLKAEEASIERKKKNLQCSKTISSQKLWKRLLSALKQGQIFIVFEDSNKVYDVFPKTAPNIQGLDGVGSFPLSSDKAKEGQLNWTAWPSMAVNLVSFIDNSGKPLLDVLEKTVFTALRMMDNAISLSTKQQSFSVNHYRPICLGNIGFNDAVNKIIYMDKTDTIENPEENLLNWTSGLAEAWAMAVISGDQQLCKERGAAPAFLENNKDVFTFNPIESINLLRFRRNNSLRINLKTNTSWDSIISQLKNNGHRFTSRSCWAPFKSLAAIAGVSPGGIGSVSPIEFIEDITGKERLIPTPLLFKRALKEPSKIKSYNKCLKYPMNINRWDSEIREIAFPNQQTWRKLMEQASLVRPWIDQGVSLTLPLGLNIEKLNILLQEAWWSGLNVVRFELNQINNQEEDTESLDITIEQIENE